MEELNLRLQRVPFLLIAIAACVWLGYSYYGWRKSPESELGQLKATHEVMVAELEKSKAKLKAGEEFFRNLDNLRARIRMLTAQLDGTKAILSGEIDVAGFMRMISLEAKKVGVTIKAISPNPEKRQEFFTEYPYTVSFRGAYVQIMVFFDRIAHLQRIIRIGDFELKPVQNANAMAKYVDLEGKVQLISYKYLGTSADEILNKQEMKAELAMPTLGDTTPSAAQRKADLQKVSDGKTPPKGGSP